MSLDTKAAEISEKLEKLAINLGENFLRYRKNNEGVINLSGHEPEILDFIKEKMEHYFEKKGQEVIVQTGNERQGYPIDIGYFTSRIFAQ